MWGREINKYYGHWLMSSERTLWACYEAGDVLPSNTGMYTCVCIHICIYSALPFWQFQFISISLSYYKTCQVLALSFPGVSEGKAPASNVGNPGSIPVLGRSPGEGNGNPPQYFCLENPMDVGAWKATVHGVEKNQTRLSDFTSLHLHLYELGLTIYVWAPRVAQQ